MQEALLLVVDGVDDEAEKLVDLSLEGKGLGIGRHNQSFAREKTQERSSEKQTGRMGLKIQKCACSSSINGDGDGFCASGGYQRARVVAEIRFLAMKMPVRSKKRLYREGRRR